KFRRRRNRKNGHNPHHSLSPEEMIALGTANSARLERRTYERMAIGKPMAPSNTNKFLLEDRKR
ncbi:hypothetical protein Angca_001033, partial [Angiostrongylus cantonensis]